MKERIARGRQIGKIYSLYKEKGAWIVPSKNGERSYRIRIAKDSFSCTCRDYELKGKKCKHIVGVEYSLKHPKPVGRPRKAKPPILRVEKRKTYPQNWSTYNPAQTNEKEVFLKLLFDLCKDIPPLEQSFGRPRMPISDAVFSVVFKVYSLFSGRRFMSDLRYAQEKGYISKTPHFNSLFNYMEMPELTPILVNLIETVSLSMNQIEEDFAADSTGLTSSMHSTWFSLRYGGIKWKHKWVKLHLMCGVKTHIITAVQIHGKYSNDVQFLPALLDTTAKNFKIREVSGDKAYASLKNIKAVVEHGGMPYFAFRSHTTGLKGGKKGLWWQMYHKFCLHREDYLKHYHKRSNVETVMHMLKSKFGEHIFSKTETAMKNEVLCKVLCHNLCRVISGMYELGIDPEFREGVKFSGSLKSA